ncbi:MAG: DUF2085 domain-containing protein [Candidatus Fermentibacteria bacterium]|nr:DUF2085 domain-containing protein [Candidatus Fermentibacteria bacterium]
MRIPGLMVNLRRTGSVLMITIGAVFVFGAFVNPPFLRPLLGLTCHRLPHRSFDWAPGLCARCTFFWIGIFLSSLLMFFRKLPGSTVLGLFLMLPMALDGSFQFIGLYESTNIMRLLTGFSAGIGLCMFLESGATSD